MGEWTESQRDKRLLTAGEAFGERLQEIRRKRGWTQEDLASRLDDLGFPIHRVTLGQIEKGGTRARNVTLEEVLAIALALGVPPVMMMAPFSIEVRLRVVGRRTPAPPDVARAWIVGHQLLEERPPVLEVGELPSEPADAATYYLEIPPEKLAAVVTEARELAYEKPIEHWGAYYLRLRDVEAGLAPPIEKEVRDA
jgi:transcriptional regulator with XRE-family HTH domain